MNEQSLSGVLETVWGHLSRGVADRKHPARYPTLATVGPDGPELRTLVLRAASRADATLDLFTDRHSPKAAQIARDPRIALHIWLPKPQLQFRLRARAELLPGDPARFAQLPEPAQANYAGLAPGTPLPAEAAPSDGAARFTRLVCHIQEIDVLNLNQPHRRARFTADDGWQGQWIAP